MNRRVLAGGDVLVDGQLVAADVVIHEGVIAEVRGRSVDDGTGTTDRDEPTGPDGTILDCRGKVIAPGFIDLQCNGAVGVDITTEPHRLLEVAAALPHFGVTSFLPTVVTAPVTTRCAAIEAMGVAREAGAGPLAAMPLGLHFEGPLISRDHLGAHVGRFATAPSGLGDEVDSWATSGAVSLVTLAPELPDAIDVVRRLTENGVVVSAGHTAMSPSEFGAAREAGLSYVTHLYNAMAPFEHRAPGPIGAVLADDWVVVGLICDGVHVDPVAVAMAWQSLGPDRLSLVSDASPALGAPYGRFNLGGFEVIHDGTGVRTTDGVLAGSALELDRAVRNLIAYTGCSLSDALATVTSTPADLLGLTDRGRIATGARADLVVLDASGNLEHTIIGGQTAWLRR